MGGRDPRVTGIHGCTLRHTRQQPLGTAVDSFDSAPWGSERSLTRALTGTTLRETQGNTLATWDSTHEGATEDTCP